MRRITKCKLALMEKDPSTEIEDLDKSAFIIRYSGSFLPEEYLNNTEQNGEDISIDEYRIFIENSLTIIYNTLIDEASNKLVETVGIWLTTDDDKEFETSMDISTLDLIGESSGTNSITELAKIILDRIYES
jgi:hypothetical protein